MLLPGGLEDVIGKEEEGRFLGPMTMIFLAACTPFPWGQILSALLCTIHSLAA